MVSFLTWAAEPEMEERKLVSFVARIRDVVRMKNGEFCGLPFDC